MSCKQRGQLIERAIVDRGAKAYAMNKRPRAVKDSRVLLDELKDLLISEGNKPGDRIDTEVELAKRFNLSRARIREATTALCQMGVLETRPRRGTIIKSFDPVVTAGHLGFHFAVGGLPLSDSREPDWLLSKRFCPSWSAGSHLPGSKS